MKEGGKAPVSRADLLAHPVRQRIIFAVAGQPLTTQQIATVLPDIPPATLYRNIRQLAEAGVLQVVREIPVRGTVEKVYTLVHGANRIGGAELAAVTPEEHWRYFTVFFATLLSWLRSYLQQESIDAKADGLTCRGTTLWLSDVEHGRLLEEMSALVQSRADHPQTSDRRRRIIGLIAIPERRDRCERPDNTGK